jgi:hypothetical protein
MSMSDDDHPGSVKGLCTSEGKNNGWEPAEILQLGPIEVETSRAFGDNSTRDVDISHARVPEGRKGGRMTDEEFFRKLMQIYPATSSIKPLIPAYRL